MSATVLAIDLGGTRYRAGIASSADPAGLLALGEWPTPASRDEFLEMLQSQLAEHAAARLGIGVPGLAEGAKCRWIPNLSYLDGLDLANSLPSAEVALGNDAQFALLAEFSAGAAAGLSDAILLAIGTGIGSAVLADGHIVAGGHGGACSFGWAAADLAVFDDDRAGWLESQSSGRALDLAAARIGLNDGAELVATARAGDPRATAALRPRMEALGVALAGAVALLDPQAVIFAGFAATAFNVLAPFIRPALLPRLPPHLRGVELRAARFGPRAGLVGAAFAGARGGDWRRRAHD